MRKIAVLLATVFIASCAVNSGVVTTGPDTFFVSRQAATGFTGLSGLRPEALKEGGEHCAKMGKQFIELGSRESQPPYLAGNFPRVEIQFRCGVVGPSKSQKCYDDLKEDPTLAILKEKVALAGVKDQTFAMLADITKPTAKEKEALKAWGNKRDVCMKLRRDEDVTAKAPVSVTTLGDSYHTSSQVLIIDLINEKLTYADYSLKRQALVTFVNDTFGRIQAELRKETADAGHRAEQLAIEAQRNSIMQQKIYSESQMKREEIQSNERISREKASRLNTTVTTECVQNGPGVRCTTH